MITENDVAALLLGLLNAFHGNRCGIFTVSAMMHRDLEVPGVDLELLDSARAERITCRDEHLCV